MNVYTVSNKLVSVLKQDKEASMVITSKGEIAKVKTGSLVPAKLLAGANYDERFVQAAIGGLVTKPSYHSKGNYTYHGVSASILVSPVSATIVKVAEGIPNSAYPDSAKDILHEVKTNTDKNVRYPEIPQSEQKVESEMNDDLLPLDSGEGEEREFENVPKLTLEWKNIENISIARIQEFFEEHSDFLPQPSVIKIDTGDDTVVKRKKGAALEAATITKKADYYAPSPIMERTCKVCQAMNMIHIDKKTGYTTVKCSVCPTEYAYEGALEGQGLSGGDKI